MIQRMSVAWMRRLAEAKAESHADAPTHHLRLTPITRLRRSMVLSAAYVAQARRSARLDDPGPFYERARALGLCDP